MKPSNTNIMQTRLLSWSIMSIGLGIGLLVTSFMGENNPRFTLWGIGMISAGVVILLVSRLFSRGNDGT